jgi:purine-binding chemotaxis protein CheW
MSDLSSSIDWQALWQQLDWDDEAHREEARRLRLSQRARQYASLPPEAEDDTSSHFVLVFELGQERYGIDVRLVRKVLRIQRIFPVPGTPPFYLGVVNVRGQIVTVADLRLFFDMPADRAETANEIIVVEANKLEIGILARHVHDIISVPRSELESLDDVRYARGITAERLVLLDIARLFEDERLVIGGAED